MDYSILFPSRFLKSVEFKGKDVTLTISGIVLEELPEDSGKTKAKGILAFKETKKQLVLNRTNAECLKGMFGRETDNWKGKRVTLFPAPFNDPFGGEATTCIRVRGSPDIQADMDVEVKLPRKRPQHVKMKRTGKVVAQVQKQPEPPPEADAEGPDDFGGSDFPAVSLEG